MTEATKPQTREAHSAEKLQLIVSSDVTSKIHLSDSLLKKVKTHLHCTLKNNVINNYYDCQSIIIYFFFVDIAWLNNCVHF